MFVNGILIMPIDKLLVKWPVWRGLGYTIRIRTKSLYKEDWMS
jgi:hypothetical protein